MAVEVPDPVQELLAINRDLQAQLDRFTAAAASADTAQIRMLAALGKCVPGLSEEDSVGVSAYEQLRHLQSLWYGVTERCD